MVEVEKTKEVPVEKTKEDQAQEIEAQEIEKTEDGPYYRLRMFPN